jgi:hypothetical protein
MESRIADQEEEKRARERIRQRIADDKVCCSKLKILLNLYKKFCSTLLYFFSMLIIHSINPLSLTFLLPWISAMKNRDSMFIRVR